MLEKPVEIRLPMRISLDRASGEALLEVSGRKLRLKKGEFSPWVRLTFKPGLGLKIRGIARFLVSRIEPHFEMYVTPLNIDPAKPALPISHPLIYSVYLAKLLGSFITLGEANDTWALNEGALSERDFLDPDLRQPRGVGADVLQRPGQDAAGLRHVRLRDDRQPVSTCSGATSTRATPPWRPARPR